MSYLYFGPLQADSFGYAGAWQHNLSFVYLCILYCIILCNVLSNKFHSFIHEQVWAPVRGWSVSARQMSSSLCQQWSMLHQHNNASRHVSVSTDIHAEILAPVLLVMSESDNIPTQRYHKINRIMLNEKVHQLIAVAELMDNFGMTIIPSWLDGRTWYMVIISDCLEIDGCDSFLLLCI